jgi:hypothetical protein
MRDRFSNLAAVRCEETIAKKVKELSYVYVWRRYVSAGKPQIYFRPWAVERRGLGISRMMEKRLGVIDWVERRSYAVCNE